MPLYPHFMKHNTFTYSLFNPDRTLPSYLRIYLSFGFIIQPGSFSNNYKKVKQYLNINTKFRISTDVLKVLIISITIKALSTLLVTREVL